MWTGPYSCMYSVRDSSVLALPPLPRVSPLAAAGDRVDGRASFGVERDGDPTRKRLVLRVLEPGGAQAANHRHPLEPVGHEARHWRQGKKKARSSTRIIGGTECRAGRYSFGCGVRVVMIRFAVRKKYRLSFNFDHSENMPHRGQVLCDCW